jgi:hypothetical protein
MPLQVRRGTNAQRQVMTEPLASGELLYATDTGTLYIGNGTTLGGIAVANLSAQDVKDLSAALFTSGSHSGISFDYDSELGTIDATVDPDLSNYQGVIRASAFSGSLVADDSGLLVDALNSSINLDGTVKGDIIPDQSEAYDIGSSSRKFRDLYLSGSSLFLGDATITSTGSAVNLPSGSTVGGVAIGTGSEIVGSGVVEGSNYKINIIGDDSALLINSSTGEHFGAFKGSFFATDSTQIIDGTTGKITGSFEGNIIGSVIADDLTLLVDKETGEHFGLFKGSFFGEDSTQIIDGHSGVVTGSFVGNLLGSVNGNLVGSINATGNLTGNVIGTLTGNVIGNTNGTHFGNVFGEVEGNTTGFHRGDIKGSVFADDSTLLIDGISGSANLTSLETTIISSASTLSVNTVSQMRINASVKSPIRMSGLIEDGSIGNAPQFDLHAIRGTQNNPAAPNLGDYLGALRFTFYEGVADIGNSVVSLTAQVDPSADLSDSSPSGNLVILVNAGDGNGDAGDGVWPFQFKYTGTFDAPTLKTGSYATSSEPSSPEAGMIIFDSTTQKYKGYVSDTGLAGGGASNSTPGWVNLN